MVKPDFENLGLLKRGWSLNVWYNFWANVSWVDLGSILQKTINIVRINLIWIFDENEEAANM